MGKLDNDAAFAAGVISYAGSFMVVKSGINSNDKVVRFSFRTSNRQGAVEQLARIAGVEVTRGQVNGKEATGITIQGSNLHRLMTTLWEYLPVDRKRDYANARLKLKKRQ